MGEEWKQDPNSTPGQTNQDDLDKRLEDIKRKLTKGANDAQLRIKRAFNKAGDYWQSAQQTALTPHQPSSVEEHIFVNSPISGVLKTGEWHVIWVCIWIQFHGAPTKFGN
jgi:hypothetical protein